MLDVKETESASQELVRLQAELVSYTPGWRFSDYHPEGWTVEMQFQLIKDVCAEILANKKLKGTPAYTSAELEESGRKSREFYLREIKGVKR